jgi:hypothetical protein
MGVVPGVDRRQREHRRLHRGQHTGRSLIGYDIEHRGAQRAGIGRNDQPRQAHLEDAVLDEPKAHFARTPLNTVHSQSIALFFVERIVRCGNSIRAGVASTT